MVEKLFAHRFSFVVVLVLLWHTLFPSKIDPYQPPSPCSVSPVLCCFCVLRALCRATGIRQLAVGSEVLVRGSVIVGLFLQC